jgi:predicted aminopeptidase
VVWNVHAAPEFSLQPHSWRYPLLGKLTYRGYFSEEQARAYGRQLEEQGMDVYVSGVEAYSTLGWFKDPLLNTFIHREESDLADVIFHELAHQRLFIRGDTAFNEAFATAVAHEGVRRWVQAQNRPELYDEYQRQRQRKEQFVQLVFQARQSLAALYGESLTELDSVTDSAVKRHSARTAEGESRTPEQAAWMRGEKHRIIEQLREQYGELKKEWDGDTGYDRWFARSLNNAQLNTVATYYRLVPGFHQLIVANNGDLERFYEQVEQLGKLPKRDRHHALMSSPAPILTQHDGL